MIYTFVVHLLRIIVRSFFRQVEVIGLEQVPAQGAVIFAGNHPNSLLDPVLVLTTSGRRVHFAAKDTLFKSIVFRPILKSLGAVPIARADDHGPKKLNNASAFEAMFAVLGEGAAIGIFPEGLSHDASQLQRLKTGAARLAFGASDRVSAPVAIVPCGLTFINPSRFRSRVLVRYGEPIIVDGGWREKHAADGPEAVKELTVAIEQALRTLTINATDWDTARSLDVVRRLYQPLHIRMEERVELSRRFNLYYEDVKSDPRVVEVMNKIHRYQERLDDVGVTDRELSRGLGSLEIAWRVVRYLTLLLLWIPLSLPGAPLHLGVIALARLAGRWLTPRKDVVATTKLVSSLVLLGLAYAAVGLVVYWRFGLHWALVTGAVLVLSGFATLRVLDQGRLLGRGLAALLHSIRLRREVEALQQERQQLSKEVIALVTQLVPEGVVPLFSRSP